jgi:Translation initiation factor IF-2, N-terminal region
VANHLTPTELAEEMQMKRQEVIGKCMQMGVPIFHGRIDRSLFVTSLRQLSPEAKPPRASTALH